MQRHRALRKLSSDHHSGLVIARRARHAAQEELSRQAAAWQRVTTRFQTELEGHFRLEEVGLLAALSQAGETRLVARTLREHASLRRLIAQDRVENLLPFAELLTAHIRFEEKELFETAQRVLDVQTLEGLMATEP
jgi:hemerythrin-like domain-containing protein